MNKNFAEYLNIDEKLRTSKYIQMYQVERLAGLGYKN